MGAFLAPDGFAVFEPNVVRRTLTDALPAAGAGIRCPKPGGFHDEAVEDRVDRSAHEAVIEIASRRGKGLSVFQAGDDLCNRWFCLFHDLPGLLRLRHGEHCDVVFWHDDLRRAHVAQPLPLHQPPVVLGRIADFAAAVHHEPDALRSGQLRLSEPVGCDAGNAPRIRWGNHDHVTACLDGRMVARLDLGVQVGHLLPQGLRRPPGDIPAVPGSGKAENHGLIPPRCFLFPIIA